MFNFTTAQTPKKKEFAENEIKNGTKGTAQELDSAVEQRIDEIEKQRLEFARKNPGFDMRKEMENADFINYVWVKGLSVEEAYFLVHREEILKQLAKGSRGESAQSQERMVENGAGKNHPAIAKKNPRDLSDKEVDEIIERVRRGEKVSF